MPEREGLIAAAHDGTLFLDEIGELPVEAQAKLLRALDEGGEFQRLGETTSHRSNFRLIAATNRARAALKFDFAARIPLQIHMPTLAERVEDIPLIARSIVLRLAHTDEFARRFVHTEGVRRTVRFTSALMADLIKRDYPNNVRELEEALWGPLEHSTGDVLDLVGPTAPPANARAAGPMTPTEVTALLTKHDWTVARAAEASGMSRYVLIRLMEKYGIQK
jgi:DNA-binding NtrC family response regulator